MGLNDLQEILREFLQAIQLVMDSGEELSDEFQGQIAQTLQLLWSRIEEARQQQSPADGLAPTPPTPPAPPQGMPSSNVAGTSYDDKTGDLQVQFLGKYPNREGPRYVYPDTPPQIAELVQEGLIPARTKGSNSWGSWHPGKVPSAGASVFTLLKDRNVPYQRVS